MTDQVRPDAAGMFPELLPGPLRSFYGDVSMGNATRFRIGVMKTMGGIFVGVEGFGAALFQGSTTAYSVHRNLGVPENDSGNFADLINDQLAVTGPRQGAYHAAFCNHAGANDEY
jgi:hypothetical protein